MSQNDFATLRGVLAALEAKIRRAWTLRGLAITAAALCAAAVFSFLLDYFLDLPLAVRAVHLGLMLTGVFLLARWALLRPLAVRTTESDLAQSVEHGVPDLRDRLVSALDFEKRLSDPSDPESVEMMADVVRDAATRAARIDPGLLIDARPVRRAMSLAAASALLLVGTAAAFPEDFSLWLARGVLLRGVPWPRRTHVRVLDFPADGPKIVTRGEDLRVVAVADGEQPSELVLHYEELAEPDPAKGPDAKPEVTFVETRRMYALEGESENGDVRHAFDFHAVSASFRFWVTGGDDQDEAPVYSVLALVPPRVASIAGRIVYPKYAGLPDGEVRDASFETLRGSHVEMKITANMPLAIARMVPTDAAAPTNLPLGADGMSMTIAFDVEKPVDFHLELTATRGHANRADEDMFHVRPAEDRPPDLRVLYPPSRLYRTPKGIVPIKLVAKDDFRVEKVSIETALGTTPAGAADLWPVASEPAPADRRRVDLYKALDLMTFGGGDSGQAIKPGDVLHLSLRAVDSRGNETTSGDLAVETLSVEDFERRLSQKQGTLREDLQVVTRNQARARAAIRDLKEAVSKLPVDAAAVDRGRNLQVDNGRVGADVVQFLNGIHQVFDAYVLDRVGADSVVDKLLPLYHEALAKPSDEEVFPASLYKRIVEEKRAERVFDAEVLGALLDIMDIGDRATTEVSPAVYKALAAFAGDPAHDKAELDRAEKSAAELGALLAEIDQKMQRWGELSLLIEMARVIRGTMDQLSKDPAGTKGLAPK